MSTSEVRCPRCGAGAQHCKVQHAAREAGQLLWQVFHCERCAFTWRSTEPARTLDPALRDSWTQMQDLDPAHYRSCIPPARDLTHDPARKPS